MRQASTIFTYYVNFNDSYTDAEIDAVFAGAKMLGARGCVGSQGLARLEAARAFPGRHGMFLGHPQSRQPVRPRRL